MDPNLIEKLGDFLLKLVKLPRLELIIALLLILNGVQYYTKKTSDSKYDEIIKEMGTKLDTCRKERSDRDLFWTMKIDSIRVIYADELRARNKELEELNRAQDRNNTLVERTINNLRKPD